MGKNITHDVLPVTLIQITSGVPAGVRSHDKRVRLPFLPLTTTTRPVGKNPIESTTSAGLQYETSRPTCDQGIRCASLTMHQTQIYLTSHCTQLELPANQGPRIRGPLACHIAELPELLI